MKLLHNIGMVLLCTAALLTIAAVGAMLGEYAMQSRERAIALLAAGTLGAGALAAYAFRLFR